jgi:hypothetical protein
VLEVVDRLADDPGRPHLEQSGRENGNAAQDEGQAVALEIREKVS